MAGRSTNKGGGGQMADGGARRADGGRQTADGGGRTTEDGNELGKNGVDEATRCRQKGGRIRATTPNPDYP